MGEWRNHKLGDFVEIQTGPFGTQLHAHDYVAIGTPSIMPTNIGQRLDVLMDEIACVSDKDIERLKRYVVKPGDIVYSRRGDVEKCAYMTEKQNGWLCGGGCLRLRVNSETLDSKFCAYYLSTRESRSWILNSAVGSTMPNLNSSILLNFPIVVPDLPEQKAIAEVLSSLDDKIDLLHRQNKTLESLAQTLFRQWFIEGADDSWETAALGDLFDIGIGRTPPRKEQHWFSTNPSDIKWISIKDMGNCGVYIDSTAEYLTAEAVEQFNVPIIPPNTILLSFKMTLGRLAITTETMLSNEAIAHFKHKGGSSLFPEFLYLFLKTYKFELLGSTSSIVEAINSQMIKEMEMVVPDDVILGGFRELVTPMFSKIRENSVQIETLTRLRDSLLPKLMIGEAIVNFGGVENGVT